MLPIFPFAALVGGMLQPAPSGASPNLGEQASLMEEEVTLPPAAWRPSWCIRKSPRWMIAAALAVFLVGGALASWTRSGTQSSTHTDDEVSFLEQAEVLKKVVLYQKVRLLSNLTEEELQRHKIDVVSLPPTGPLFVQQKETRLIARNLGYKTSYSHQDNTITITQETSKDVFVRVSMCIADVTLAALKMMSALLSLEASIHVCNLHTPESEDAKWEKVWSGNRRLRDIVPKTRRLAFNVPQSSVKGQSVQEAKMSCAAQINGIISSFLAVSQYVSDTITSCPAPNDIPKGSNYPARCSMSISVLTSGATKSASALSDIAVQCADPTNGDIPYSREIDPDRAPQVLAACLNNIGQAIDYIVKTAYELNALATEPGHCPKFPTTYQRYICTEHIASLLADLGQVATYLSGAASGCGRTTLVPMACSSRLAATVTGLFDMVQGIGGSLAWCNYPGYVKQHVAQGVQELKQQAHNARIQHKIHLP